MSIRATILAAATVAAVALVSVIPLRAAMPVAGGPAAAENTDLIQVAKKRSKKSARQKEIDSSVDSGTVPARYRSRVPKQYHQYIPFAK